jgi:hypothetical protein
MRRRYYELVELARVCWRQSQTTWTREAARALRRTAREYLQEAAKLDGGRLPDIGLVCLKEARQAAQARRPSHASPREGWEERGRGMWGDNESGWIDARRKQPAHGQRVLALRPMDDEGDKVDVGQKPCAWVIARWDGHQRRWGVLDAAGKWHAPEYIGWWCEVPQAPKGIVIVP